MGIFDRRSLEQIRRDNARLNAEREVRESMRERDRERKALSKENFNLRHGGKVRVVKNVGSGLGWVGKGIGSGVVAMGNQYAKAQASKQPPKRKRRVKKVRKKNKPKNNSFTITYN